MAQIKRSLTLLITFLASSGEQTLSVLEDNSSSSTLYMKGFFIYVLTQAFFSLFFLKIHFNPPHMHVFLFYSLDLTMEHNITIGFPWTLHVDD